MPDFSNYSTDKLQISLNVIRSQNIKGATQDFGDVIEEELKSRNEIKNEEQFISLIIRKVAQTSVSSSALRNQGAKGILEISRDYFEKEIDLKDFKRNLYSDKFIEYLNDKTLDLVNRFPENGKSWGAARKGLNLFFRDVVYNHYLRQHLDLNPESINHFQQLEVPLDKDVANGLIAENENPNLKKWISIKSLSQSMSDKYQNTALKIAKKKGILRVHLDLAYWRKNR